MKATRTINVLLLPCILMTSVRCDVTHTRDELQRIFEDVAMNGLHVQRIQVSTRRCPKRSKHTCLPLDVIESMLNYTQSLRCGV